MIAAIRRDLAVLLYAWKYVPRGTRIALVVVLVGLVVTFALGFLSGWLL